MFAFDPSGNAKGRLLPPDVPFRFFGAAILFNALAWLAFLLASDEASQGLSMAAAGALHLATLGVLATTAVGASFQLLPVATMRPVRSIRLCKLTFWLLIPGVLLFAAGLLLGNSHLAEAGGGLAGLALLLFLGLLIDNLRAVKDMPQVVRHAWVAAAALGLLVVLGMVLAANLMHGFLGGSRTAFALAHGLLAAYGFMGMMLMGLSYILIPMFALAPAPEKAPALRSAFAGGAAVALGAVGALAGAQALLVLASLLGLIAFALYLRNMKAMIDQRMRKQLGIFFRPIFAGWFLIAASLIIGFLLALGVLSASHGPLFVFALVGGLTTFLLGVLQRIMPFLASMHCAGPSGRTPTLSQLSCDRLAKAFFALHLAALVLVFAGLAHGWGLALRAGAALGLAAALVFIVFALDLWRRASRHKRAV
jgi:hypothetical protein